MAKSPFDAARVPLIDRLIGWASPRQAIARHFDRIRLQRAYEAASPRDGWRPRRVGASANADHAADASIIRGKARALVQNVPYVSAGLEALVSNTVGTGITTYATGANAARINALWAEWCKVCDADGRFDWYGIQAAAYRAMEQDGEVLIRLRPRLSSDGLPAPLQLQLLEIDWLDTARMTGAAGANVITNGIEYDALGKAVAYWLWDQHPGNSGVQMRGASRSQSRRIPAEAIIHLYNPDRPGQGRGFSRLAPVIARVRDLQLYEDAELARKNLEARLSVLVSGDVSAMANPGQFGESNDATTASRTGDLGELTSGGITSLPPGLNVTTVAPTPAQGYTEYVKQQLHVIAVGMGVTYEMMTGDMKEVNFSSARVRQQDFRRQVEARQWLCLIPRLILPVWTAFVQAAILGRQAPAGAYVCEHNTPKWDYVNPQQDANSELTLISAGLLTISESLRRRGYKPETVFAELKTDFDSLRANGVLEVLLAMQGKTDPQAAQAAQDAAEQAVQSAAESAQASADATMQQLRAELLTVRGEIASAIDRKPAETHNHFNVAPPDVTVRNEVNPTPVTVTNEVAAPEVTVRNEVNPTPVTVNATLTTPPRRTEGTVERDKAGRVLRTVQVETDVPPAGQP